MAIHLFRGLKDGKMLYSKDCYDLAMFFSLIDINTLMMHTGKNDIYGTPVYEGDYVFEFKKTKKEMGKYLFKVEWSEFQMGFLFRYFLESTPNNPTPNFDYPARYSNVKIMGNIIENPELEKTWKLEK